MIRKGRRKYEDRRARVERVNGGGGQGYAFGKSGPRGWGISVSEKIR
jgi:hypothetical protein